MAAVVLGRPGRVRVERWVQRRLSHWRCQRTTVSGCTTIKAVRQSCHALASRTQNSRSLVRRCGRDPSAVNATSPVEIACDAPDDEHLLVDWLNTLVYEMATRRMLFAAFVVAIEGPQHLQGRGASSRRNDETAVRAPQGRDARVRSGSPGSAARVRVDRPAGPDGRNHGDRVVCDGWHQRRLARSFGSSCHGAGRSMSRHQAVRRWKGRELVDELARKGMLIRSPSSRGVAEEAPGAYKDVTAVVEAADGLACRGRWRGSSRWCVSKDRHQGRRMMKRSHAV